MDEDNKKRVAALQSCLLRIHRRGKNPVGLTSGQTVILTLLFIKGEAMRNMDLQTEGGLHRNSVNGTVISLESHGFIKCYKAMGPGEVLRRYTYAKLTDRGRDYLLHMISPTQSP
jgi:DNA-binding MarR family transcriptional regulator